jgi:hypothetical protein
MAHDVFISYSSKDKLTAEATCAVLEQNGIRCWIAPRDITPGMSWGASIIDAINQARVMVLVFSGHTNKSSRVEREIERAVNRSIPIIPMRITDISPDKSIELFISTPHWLDAFSPPLEKHLKRLAEIVRHLLASQYETKTQPEFGTDAGAEQQDKTEASGARSYEGNIDGGPRRGAGQSGPRPGTNRQDQAAKKLIGEAEPKRRAT